MAKPFILLLDDDEAMRKALPLELRQEFDVISVATEQEAVARIKAEQGAVDVALVDMRLGEDDWEGGLRVIRTIRTLEAPPEIIVLTAYADIKNAAKCMEAGAFSYVEKSGRFVAGSMTMTDLLIATMHRALDTRALKKQLEEQRKERVTALARCLAVVIDTHEPYSERHSERVAQCARIIAEACGLDQSRCENVALAGHIHDLGMLGIDINVLTRPGPLTPIEWAMIHAHPQEAARILESVGLTDLIPAILDHHKWHNSAGYPARKPGDALSIEGQILGLADTFDAMVSPRPYRTEVLSLDDALYTLTTPYAPRHPAGRFAPEVMKAFQQGFDRIRNIYDPYAFTQEGQHKRFTVWCASLVHAGQLAVEIGDFRMKQAVENVYIKRMKDLVKFHKGIIIKDMRESWIGIFHQAEQAVSCAMRLQQSLVDDPILDGRLQAKIGLHTAEVFAQHRSYGREICGPGVSCTVYLVDKAASHEILLSDTTYRELPESLRVHFTQAESWTPPDAPDPIQPWSYRVHAYEDTSRALA